MGLYLSITACLLYTYAAMQKFIILAIKRIYWESCFGGWVIRVCGYLWHCGGSPLCPLPLVLVPGH